MCNPRQPLKLQTLALLFFVLKGALEVSAQTTIRPKDDSITDTLHFRVVSYNIRRGLGTDDKTDLARTASVLKKLQPDFVGMQEVDVGALRSGSVDQAKELGKQLDMHPAFGSFMDFQGGQYGMAILSRFPIKSVHQVKLPDGNEPRVALAVEILLPNGESIMLVNVHFDWVTDDSFRFAQATTLKKYLTDLTMPQLLIGDFNDLPNSRTVGLFKENMVEAKKPTDDRLTFSSTKPEKEIDFIFVAPQENWQVLKTVVLDEPMASDHRPVVADIQFEKSPVEQDPALSRATYEPFSEQKLFGRIVLRGGTSLQKLFIHSVQRYSENVDLVQFDAERIGDVIDVIRSVLDSWLGEPRRKRGPGTGR